MRRIHYLVERNASVVCIEIVHQCGNVVNILPEWANLYHQLSSCLLAVVAEIYEVVEHAGHITTNMYRLVYVFVNSIYRNGDVEFHFPRFAYGSVAGSFSGWGANIHIGKQGFQTGDTKIGSVIYNKTFETDAYVNLNLFSEYFKYSMDVVQISNEKWFYLHQFTVRPHKTFKISVLEGSMLNAPFEIRYMNPLMVMHQFASWTEYDSDGLNGVYGENHFCAYLAGLQKESNKFLKGKFVCPAVDERNLTYDFNGKFSNRPMTAGMFMSLSVNTYLSNTYERKNDLKQPGLRITTVKEPAKLVYYTDGNGQGSTTGYQCKWKASQSDTGMKRNVPARHKGGANFNYADGHTACLKWEDFPTTNEKNWIP